jgi:hypothetical protein
MYLLYKKPTNTLFDSLLLHSTAPTCFDALESSLGSFSMPAELHEKHVQIYGIQ